MASAKLANKTVNQSQREICREKPIAPAPVTRSLTSRMVVSAAPTSTTNITGFLRSVIGFSFTNDARAARPTISGSKRGRERASFFGRSEAGSSWGASGLGVGGAVKADMVLNLQS